MSVTFDPLVQEEPYAAYRELRSRFPVYRNDERGFWALSRFDDVQRAARELADEPERIATHNTRGIARLPIVPA